MAKIDELKAAYKAATIAGRISEASQLAREIVDFETANAETAAAAPAPAPKPHTRAQVTQSFMEVVSGHLGNPSTLEALLAEYAKATS